MTVPVLGCCPSTMAGSCELEKEMLCLCRQDHDSFTLIRFSLAFRSFRVTAMIIGCTSFTPEVFPDVGKELRDALVGNQGRGLGCWLGKAVLQSFCPYQLHPITSHRICSQSAIFSVMLKLLKLLFFGGPIPHFCGARHGVFCPSFGPGLLISAIRKNRASLEAAHLRAESEDVWAPGHVMVLIAWLDVLMIIHINTI